MAVRSGRSAKGRRSPWGVVLLALVMLGLGLGIGYGFRKAEVSPEPAAHATARKPLHPAPKARPSVVPAVPPETRPAPSEARSKPKIAIVIDDLGQADPELVTRLCAQPIPLTVAVLPFLKHSERSADLAHDAGKEVMLHLPMEPLGYPGPGKDPGQGAVMFGLSEPEVRARVRSALMNVPHRQGVNNHMGSRITPDVTRMRWVLEEIRKKNCYFVDSRTEKNSVAFDVAESLGMRSVRRRVFLDDDRSAAAIEQQWQRALDLAKTEGEVLVIGHIDPETLGVLERVIPRSRDTVEFVFAGVLAKAPARGQDPPATTRSK